MSLVRVLREVTIRPDEWNVHDLRCDLPRLGPGSDAMNQHTQYSNPVVVLNRAGIQATGISFTLGEGNDLLCAAIRRLVELWEGVSLADLLEREGRLATFLANPMQLRWLSPNAGVVYMAAGAILNTLLDWAARRLELPLWRALAREATDDLMLLVNSAHLGPFLTGEDVRRVLAEGECTAVDRMAEVSGSGLPVYYTTWFGTDPVGLSREIESVVDGLGIRLVKVKIGPDPGDAVTRVAAVRRGVAGGISLSVDANQTMSFDQAVEASRGLADLGVVWLEEPFAPDDVRRFVRLRSALAADGISLEIVTGENCPNAHTAAALIQEGGCDRFQPDACRVLSLCDLLPILVAGRLRGVPIVPHAGGSGLDELVPHLQAFRLARVAPEESVDSSLMEYVGVCGSVFEHPTQVVNGRATVPEDPGYLGGLSASTWARIDGLQGGTAWVRP